MTLVRKTTYFPDEICAQLSRSNVYVQQPENVLNQLVP